eukprot:gene32576-42193_t
MSDEFIEKIAPNCNSALSVENLVGTPSPPISMKDNLTSFADNTFDYSSEKDQQPILYLSGE